MQYPAEMKIKLMKSIGYDLEPSLHIDSSMIQRVIDSVRNILLEWSLKLEEDGILGEDISFSDKEIKTASQNTYTINNYGNASNFQIQQGNENAAQTQQIEAHDLSEVKSLMREIEGKLGNLKLEQGDLDEINSDINTVKNQADSPKPKKGILREALSSIGNVIKKSTETALTSNLTERLNQILLAIS
jgi:hypothetical protein